MHEAHAVRVIIVWHAKLQNLASMQGTGIRLCQQFLYVWVQDDGNTILLCRWWRNFSPHLRKLRPVTRSSTIVVCAYNKGLAKTAAFTRFFFLCTVSVLFLYYLRPCCVCDSGTSSAGWHKLNYLTRTQQNYNLLFIYNHFLILL